MNFAADISVLAGMVVVAAALVAAAFLIVERSNPLFIGLLFAAVLVAPSGGRLLNRQRMAAIGKAATGIFLDRSMVPLIVLGGALVMAMRSPMEIYAVYTLGTYVSALVARVLYRRWAHAEEFSAKKTIEYRSWALIALPMLTAVAWRLLLNRIDVVMIAPLSSVYEVGMFNTAFRIAFIASLLPAMSSPVVRPMLARAFAANNHRRIVHIMRMYYIFTVVLSLAMALPIFAFARPILVLAFGEPFAPAAPVLQLLVAGTFMASIAEASASYLLMCNRERIYGIVSTASLTIAVGLNFWLIPKWGATGAAVTSLIGNFLFLAVAIVLVWRAMANHEYQVRQGAGPIADA